MNVLFTPPKDLPGNFVLQLALCQIHQHVVDLNMGFELGWTMTSPTFIVDTDVRDDLTDPKVGYLPLEFDDSGLMLVIYDKTIHTDPMVLITRLHSFYYKDRTVRLEETIDVSYFDVKTKKAIQQLLTA